MKITKIIVTGILLVMSGSAAFADDDSNKSKEPEKKVTMGAADYFRYCAVCHGVKGEGDGPMYDVLKVPPADLSRIAKHNGGEYPEDRIEDVITKGGNLRGHGISSMLAWGKVFEEYDEDIEAEKRVEALTEFIETLQVE